MRKVVLFLFLIFTLSGIAFAEEDNNHCDEYDYYLSNPEQLHKSENFGRNLAIFPGFFLHGVGHMYSGHGGKGFLLILSEFTGLFFIFADNYDPGAVYSTEPPPDPPEPDSPPEYPPMNCGLGYNDNDTGILTYIGAAMFLGSWLYDCIKTPQLVREHNRRIDRKYESLTFSLKPDLKNSTIMLNLSFNF